MSNVVIRVERDVLYILALARNMMLAYRQFLRRSLGTRGAPGGRSDARDVLSLLRRAEIAESGVLVQAE